MVQKRKVSKNNSKEHKENIKKDMKKRIKKRVKKNREDIGDISYGSRVVQHSKGVVSRAPAYKAEKIKTGGFHSTFPSGQGVLDKEMTLRAMMERGLKRQKNQNEFQAIFDQGFAGNIDTDNMTTEMKEQLRKQYGILENNKKKTQLVKELEKVNNEIAKEQETHRRIAGAIGSKRGESMITKSKTGEEKLKKKSELEKAIIGKNKTLQEHQEYTKVAKEWQTTVEKNRETKKQLDFEKKRVHEQATELFPEDHPLRQKIKDNNEFFNIVNVERRRMQEENERFVGIVKTTAQCRDEMNRLLRQRQEFDILTKEIDEGYDKTGYRSQKLSALHKIYGHDPKLLEDKIMEKARELKGRYEELNDGITQMNQVKAYMNEYRQLVNERAAELMQEAQDVIAANPFTEEHTRELASKHLMYLDEIKTTFSILNQSIYNAKEVYAKEINELDDMMAFRNHEMSEWHRKLREPIQHLFKPIVDHYLAQDGDWIDEDLTREKRLRSQQVIETFGRKFQMTPKTMYELRVDPEKLPLHFTFAQEDEED